MKSDCYNCKHRIDFPGSAHSMCRKPDPEMTGNPHGIKNGWFNYPLNYDPVWMTKECSHYEPKENAE